MGIPDRSAGAAVRWAADHLQRRAVPEPQLEAQLLLGHVLSWTRAQVLAHPARSLSRVEHAIFEALVHRRGRREPYAYLVGTRPWLDFVLSVDRNVLIPRPETEQLAELARAAVGRLMSGGTERPTVLDVGTGSGALAIAVARASPRATVIATETSTGALATAARNVDALAPGAVRLCRAHLMAGTGALPDVVVANLPYIPTADLDHLAPELAFEPRQALDGGPDGLEVIRALLAQAHQTLRPGSALLLECGHDQARAITQIAMGHWPGAAIAAHTDLAGIERFLQIEP